MAASLASAASEAADAAAARTDEKRDAKMDDAFIQHPMVGDPGMAKSKTKKIRDVDKSWEKVNQADADSAAQAAAAGSGRPSRKAARPSCITFV